MSERMRREVDPQGIESATIEEDHTQPAFAVVDEQLRKNVTLTCRRCLVSYLPTSMSDAVTFLRDHAHAV